MKKVFLLLLGCASFLSANRSEDFTLGRNNNLELSDFQEIVNQDRSVLLSSKSINRLKETRSFVDYLLEKNIKVYGLTTGFADLRNYAVSPKDAAQLSVNIIESHDAGIGAPLSKEVVLGAMLCRANSLSKGNSAFKAENLQTLISMINHKIIPVIPKYGSLGASGDLAYLARLGRAMKGDNVSVYYKGEIISAKKALEMANIKPFIPSAKEGLALTNGTSFMASMLALGYLQEVHEFENAIALQGMFLNSVRAIDAAFSASIQTSRTQWGQKNIAKIFRDFLKDSPFIDHKNIQNDYSIRCLPQILGPKLELITTFYDNVKKEINAITDNPLVYKNDEISPDISSERIITLNQNQDKWAVISGGNFHGEYITSVTDCLALANAKIALTMERQMTYMLNPDRNKILPTYLVADKKNVGLLSGYMIVQYAGNSLAQKIAHLSAPFSAHNITSGNEAEDVVSYGATAALRFLEQLELFHNLNTLYLAEVLQTYSIMRQNLIDQDIPIPKELPCEQIYALCLETLSPLEYPTMKDIPFDEVYQKLDELLRTTKIRKVLGFPIAKELNCKIENYYLTN